MSEILITENLQGKLGMEYIKNGLSELTGRSFCNITEEILGKRIVLKVTCEDSFFTAIKYEVIDMVADVIAIKYKYDYFSKVIKVSGLDATQRGILLASLIAADLESDKKYCIANYKNKFVTFE